MTGEISIPVTDMNGMWAIRLHYIQVGSTTFTGSSLTSVNFVPDPVEGYKPVGILGYATSNTNANGVTPKDSTGKSYSGNSWLCPIQVFYDPNTLQGIIQVRNYSNTGSTSTINKEGGGYVVCFVKVWVLYLKDDGAFVPTNSDSVDVSSNVQLNYNITVGAIATYGRTCQIWISQQTTQDIPAGASIGTVPKPIATVYTQNVSGGQALYIQSSDGILKTLTAIPNVTYLRCSFN